MDSKLELYDLGHVTYPIWALVSFVRLVSDEDDPWSLKWYHASFNHVMSFCLWFLFRIFQLILINTIDFQLIYIFNSFWVLFCLMSLYLLPKALLSSCIYQWFLKFMISDWVSTCPIEGDSCYFAQLITYPIGKF